MICNRHDEKREQANKTKREKKKQKKKREKRRRKTKNRIISLIIFLNYLYFITPLRTKCKWKVIQQLGRLITWR